ncbi:MAG: hypothetical protein HOP29_18035 [Phycisphaerales bacterium]|nr:hypothetical protein [Phycisphaerales bacterium]
MLASLLCSLGGGVLTVLGFSRLDLIAARFIRLPAIISCAVGAGVTVWFWRRSGLIVAPPTSRAALASLSCAAAAAVIVMLQPLAARTRSTALIRVPAILGGVCGMVAACLFARPLASVHSTGVLMALAVIGQCLGAMLLGSVTVAWLLGHAYLTATKMTITPLQSLVRWFALSVGLRGVYFVVCVTLFSTGALPGFDGPFFERIMGDWLVLSLRVAVGLLAVGVFAYMVSDCVRLRSTQSATGILYFASVFVYIGELSSQFLATEFLLPL